MILLKYGHPQFAIKNSNNNLVDTIDLDLTQMGEGMIITWTKIVIRKTTIGFKLKQKTYGRRITFDLDYSVKAIATGHGSLAEKIGKLLDYGMNDSYTIFIAPRYEDTTFVIPVLDNNDEIRLRIETASSDAEGYSELKLSYISIDLVPNFNWLPSDTVVNVVTDDNPIEVSG